MSLLIVHRDRDMAEELQYWAAALRLPGHGPVRLCHDLAGARAELGRGEAPAALVVEVDLPDGGRQAGLTLAREMRAQWTAGLPVPVVLLAPTADAELHHAIADMPACTVLCEGGSLEHEFRYLLRCLLGGAGGQGTLPAAAPEPRYEILVRVNANGDCSYEARSVNAAVPPLARQVRFGVDPKRLQALAAGIPDDPAGTDWVDRYRSVGEELMRTLFREQADVYQELGILKGLMLAAPSTKLGLCFAVDRTFYRLPFEALGGTGQGGDFRYWMEDAPLWRRLPEYTYGRRPLFSPGPGAPEPVNCLLIDANCGGEVALPDPARGPDARVAWRMASLPHAQDEIREILKELLDAMPGRVGRVGVIDMDAQGAVRTRIWGPQGRLPDLLQPRPFEQVLEELLTEGGPWQMVHFAGHSHFVGPDGREIGYLFVPRRGSGPHGARLPRAVGIASMAAWLEDARFVFLSGCSSSHREFVYHLCARNVPAMSGYPWPVLDDIAWRHSAHFYRRLLRSRSIENALQGSWLDMYGAYSHAWAWASSQFVIQATA